MSWWEALLLGLVQGLTEFIPVSSDGHLSAAEMLLPDFRQVGVLFDVLVHVGTLFAVLIYYRRFLREEAAGLFSRDLARRRGAWELTGLMALAMVPTGIVAILLKDVVEQTKSSARFVGVMEIATGLLLALSYLARGGKRERRTMTRRDALWIGLAQGFAVLPGLSRSASTIAVGLLLGLSGEWAVNFAFLLVIPAILGAAGLEIFSAWRQEGVAFFASPDFAKYLAGAAVAGAVGYLTIGWMIRLVSTRRVHLFAIYCLLFGLLLILVFP